MPILPESVKDIKPPKMFEVTQVFADEKLADVYGAVRRELAKQDLEESIPRGASVALLVGSRGIANLDRIVKAVSDHLLEIGAEPFIVPAMGSHGGGVAEEQRKIIERYGITEEAMGIPIRSSMETVLLGTLDSGPPVYADRYAASADFIIPIGRVKPHTSFDGAIESGLCKMLTIGLGKHKGCSLLHREGVPNFPTLLPKAAALVMEQKKVPFGLAIVENAHDHTHLVTAIPGCNIIREEPKLLDLAKSLMPRLCFDEIDVLVVEQIGKDITGAGMDPNITGRSTFGRSPFFTGPDIGRIVVNRLSEGTHGNAIGLGYADFTTQKVADTLDATSTYANCIASGAIAAGKLPIVLPTEEEALLAALHTGGGKNPSEAKVVKITDTLHLIHIQVSESLLPYCRSSESFSV